MADKIKNTAANAKETSVKDTVAKAAPAADVKPETKKEAPKAEVKTEAKKEAPKADAKPAAKKEAPKAEKKPAAKSSAKKEAAPKKETAKKTTKKSTSYEDVVSAAKKKMSGANFSKLKYPVAANVELSGSVQGTFYVYVADGKAAVEPYKYDDYDVYFRADADEFMNVINGKKNIYDALAEGLVKVDGNTKKAVLFINVAF